MVPDRSNNQGIWIINQTGQNDNCFYCFTDVVYNVVMPLPLSESHLYLHSYCLRPKVRFESQAADEEVILVLRAHPITQLAWVFNSIVAIILLITLNFFLPLVFSSTQIIFSNVFFVLFIFSYIFYNFIRWFFNVGIITNKRIMDVDFSDVVYKEITEARLDRVEDITSKGGGFFETFFNYGDLFIQTAGTELNIEFDNIPNPADVVRIIDDLNHI